LAWARRGAPDPSGGVSTAPGSTRASNCSASAREPTGSRARVSWRTSVSPASRSRCWATSTSSRHQPKGRHSSGCSSRTACTRPNGIVSDRVCSSPDLSRSPSGDSATAKLNSTFSRRSTAAAAPSSEVNSAPAVGPTARGSRTASTMSRGTTTAVTTSGTPSSVPATSRPLGTAEMGRSGASGVSPASPCARASSCARTSTARSCGKKASRALPVPRPASTNRSSEMPSSRAASGRTTSTAWMRARGTRMDCRRSRPVSTCSSLPSTRQRVTSQESTPAATATTATLRSTYSREASGPLLNSCERPPTKARATSARLPRAIGDRGCSRAHCEGSVLTAVTASLTARPPVPHRAATGGPAIEPPPARPGRGYARRSRRRQCAAARSPGRTRARTGRPLRR